MRLLFACLLVLSALPANAAGYLRVGAMYMRQTYDDHVGPDVDSKVTRNYIDLGAGYVGEKGWSLGGLYDIDNPSNRSSYGPTVGWVSRQENGPYALATYYFSTSVPGAVSGWGYQIDLGYKFAIRRISFAPQISYKDYEDKVSDSLTVTQTYIDPYFVIWIDF